MELAIDEPESLNDYEQNVEAMWLIKKDSDPSILNFVLKGDALSKEKSIILQDNEGNTLNCPKLHRFGQDIRECELCNKKLKSFATTRYILTGALSVDDEHVKLCQVQTKGDVTSQVKGLYADKVSILSPKQCEEFIKNKEPNIIYEALFPIHTDYVHTALLRTDTNKLVSVVTTIPELSNYVDWNWCTLVDGVIEKEVKKALSNPKNVERLEKERTIYLLGYLEVDKNKEDKEAKGFVSTVRFMTAITIVANV